MNKNGPPKKTTPYLPKREKNITQGEPEAGHIRLIPLTPAETTRK